MDDEDDIKPIDFDEEKKQDNPAPAPVDDAGVPIDEKDVADLDHDRIQYGTSVNRVKKGDTLDLSEVDPTLSYAMIGIGWELKNFEQLPLDLDASVFLLNKDDLTRENEDFIFYNNHNDRIGAVKHTGDNRTGAGEGDDENIAIELKKLSFDVVKIVFVVSIYDEEYAGLTFRDVTDVYFRFVNTESSHELFRFELDHEDLNVGEAGAIVIGVMERIGPKWMFYALGEPVKNGLGEIASEYGIIITEHVQA